MAHAQNRTTGVLWIVGLSSMIAGPAVAQDFSISASTIAGGAETMSGSGVLLAGTVGQPITGDAAGGPFTTSGGIWAGNASAPGCNAADISPVFGVLNVDDIDAFATAFIGGNLAADLDANGVINLDDIDTFVTAFLTGCS